MKPTVTVIVVTWNSSRWIRRCLESIGSQTVADRTEVVVVDNGSQDDTVFQAHQVAGGWSTLKVKLLSFNAGMGANNLGAELARGEWIYIINPDMWLEPDCLERFLERAEETGASAMGGKMLDYDGDRVLAQGCHGFDLFGNPVSSGDKAPDPFFCPAGFYFMRRDTYLRLGGIDPEMFLYGEEIDMAWRLWRSGAWCAYAPLARCHHRDNLSEVGMTSPVLRTIVNRNYLLAILKNCRGPLLALALPCVALILAEAAWWWATHKRWKAFVAVGVDPFREVWRLRGHIAERRRAAARVRAVGDLAMALQFFRPFGFGRWHEVRNLW